MVRLVLKALNLGWEMSKTMAVSSGMTTPHPTPKKIPARKKERGDETPPRKRKPIPNHVMAPPRTFGLSKWSKALPAPIRTPISANVERVKNQPTLEMPSF